MPVAIFASLLGLVVALVAYYRDAPVEQRGAQVPDWGLLPDPADVLRTEFPLAFPGYDPATVEFSFEALTRAYADLLAVAPPEVVERARARAALRTGADVPPDAAGTAAAARATPPPPTRVASVAPVQRSSLAPAPAADEEALRAEAALADLEVRGTPPDRRR